MAEAKLNFDEEALALDKTTPIYNLYDRLYKGMQTANEVDPPAFPSADDMLVKGSDGLPTFDSDGNPVIDSVKKKEIEKLSSAYSDILMKNSAYLFASSIMSVISGSGTGGGTSSGFVARAGDSMAGMLHAWYGFDAGSNGQKIFEVSIGADEKQWATVYGNLRVTEDAKIDGLLNLGQGIACGGNKVIYYDNGTLRIENPIIGVKGDMTVDGSFTLGDVVINQNGIFWGTKEFYHSGNSNKSDVDWTMQDATVYGDLTVKQGASFGGVLTALNGFSFGALNKPLFYSKVETVTDENGNPTDIASTVLDSDLHIINGNGVKFDDDYIINVRNSNVVSFSAPGMIMNLGDSDNGKDTQKISLQSGLWDYSGNFQIITKEGAGYFPNGLCAQSAVNGAKVLETYRIDADNQGVLFSKQIRFGSADGPAVYRDALNGGLNFLLPYFNSEVAGTPTERLLFDAYFAKTTSPFKDQSLSWSATLHFGTDGEFFAFDKPVEAAYFAIKSELYHTRLIEDALFFDDGKFIEGVPDGMKFTGNAYFNDNVQSPRFASGFAGYGWGVVNSDFAGGFHATFDELTVRKKMRVYELEVQKISATNGSLWVSDSCPGDIVEEIT